MKLELKIESTLGVTYAEIPLEGGKITEVAGPNASGKTSAAACAQAMLTRNGNPLGLKASDTRRDYPNDGAAPEDARVSLSVMIEDDESGEDIFWDEAWRPAAGTITAPTNDALSTAEAVGVTDWRSRTGANDRAEALQRALLPPVEHIREQVTSQLSKWLPPEDVDGVLGELDAKGWTGEAWGDVADLYAGRGRIAKRDWKKITGGETYGVAKAADWRPEGWLSEWDQLTPTAANDAFSAAQEALETLLRVQAITEAEAEAAKAAAEQAMALRGDIEKLEADARRLNADIEAVGVSTAESDEQAAAVAVNDAERAVTAAVNHLKFVEESVQSQPCPHCGQPVTTDAGQVVVFDSDAHTRKVLEAGKERDARKAELVAAKEARAAAADHCATMAAKASPLRAGLAEVERGIGSLTTEWHVQKRLARVNGDVVGDNHTRAVAEAQQATEDARTCRDDVSVCYQATRLHESIIKYSDIARALGPQGIRAKLLEAGLHRLAMTLDRVSAMTGWPLVEVADNGSVKSGRRPVVLCSESEQWRAQASVQLSLAALTEARVVVLDRADLLDSANQAALMGVLRKVLAKCPWMAVMVCATEGTMSPFESEDVAGPDMRVFLADGAVDNLEIYLPKEDQT